MILRNFTPIVSLVLLLTAAGFPPDVPAQGDGLNLVVEPPVITVDLFYRGTGVSVRAEVPRECQGAVVTLRGREGEIELDRKGKVAFLWLNVARVTVKHAPSIYLLEASEELPLLAPAEVLAGLELGYEALRKTIRIESTEEDAGADFRDFVAFKEHQGAYRMQTAMILHKAPDGSRYVSAVLEIPAGIPPGRYDVRLFCFGDGRLVDSGSASLSVEDTGLPHLVKSLAYEHGAWYGITAIAVAIVAGFGIGFLFAGRRR